MMPRRPRSASPEKNRGRTQGGTARLRTKAPIRKTNGSSRVASAPRGGCSRRFTKAPARSPRSAPRAKTAEAPKAVAGDPKDHDESGAMTLKGNGRRRPRTAPDKVPPTRPRHVLPSPKIRSPPASLRPKSIGVPPPKTTAIGFARKAGRKNQKAWGIASRDTGLSNGRLADIGNATVTAEIEVARSTSVQR